MLVFGGFKRAAHLVGGLEKISGEIEVRLSGIVGHECFALWVALFKDDLFVEPGMNGNLNRSGFVGV